MVQKPNYSDYGEHFVAFVDLLGFRSQVNQIDGEPNFDRIADMLHLLREDADTHSQLKNSRFEITCISDSVIITIPAADRLAGYRILMYLHYLQYHLLMGFSQLLRGYLAVGSAYHRDGFIFGPAYQTAYDNHNKSNTPRVVVDETIVIQGTTSIMYSGSPLGYSDVPDLLAKDADNAYFIDFTRPAGVLRKVPKDLIAFERTKIRANLEERITCFANDTHIREKYEWTRQSLDRTEQYMA